MSNYKDLDKLLEGFVRRGPSGCGCAVVRGKDIVYEGYFGLANVEEKRAVDEHTVYRIYSMTKIVTCVAALKLFEQGKFLLNEPLSEYLAEYKDTQVFVTKEDGTVDVRPAKSPILIKHAFTMGIGLPYHMFSNSPTGKAIGQVVDGLLSDGKKPDILTWTKAMGSVPLEFDPGEHWLYGYSHDVLAGLIEAVTGKRMGQYLQDEIFGPLGMKDTGYHYRDDIEQRMAAYYHRTAYNQFEHIEDCLGIERFLQGDQIFDGGGAGLYSTVRDYMKFTAMLANGGAYGGERIIGRKTIDLMRTNHLGESQLNELRSSYHAGYGYGLGVRTLMDSAAGHSNSSLGEFGWSGMAGTYASIDPSEQLAIVYMQQLAPNLEEYQHLRIRSVVNGCLE